MNRHDARKAAETTFGVAQSAQQRGFRAAEGRKVKPGLAAPEIGKLNLSLTSSTIRFSGRKIADSEPFSAVEPSIEANFTDETFDKPVWNREQP